MNAAPQSEGLRKNVLRVPEGKTAEMAAMDLMKAQSEALLAIPQILGEIADELAVIAYYCEKKGIQEALFTEDEIEQQLGGEDAGPKAD